MPALTQNSVRVAVATTISAHRNGWSDQEMAEKWGVSKGTVGNAQNKNHDLMLENWLRLGEKFGPEALNAVLALIGMKAVRLEAAAVEVGKLPLEVARALPLLIELLADNDCSDRDMRKLESAGAVDAILATADYLRQRRNEMRTNG